MKRRNPLISPYRPSRKRCPIHGGYLGPCIRCVLDGRVKPPALKLLSRRHLPDLNP